MVELPHEQAARSAANAGLPQAVIARLDSMGAEVLSRCRCQQPRPKLTRQAQMITPKRWRLAVECPGCQTRAVDDVELRDPPPPATVSDTEEPPPKVSEK